MRTYTDALLRYSIQYPADWILKEAETGPVFGDLKTGATAGISVFPRVGALGGETYLTNLFITTVGRMYSDVQTVSEDTQTFSGVTWHYLLIKASRAGTAYNIDVYAKVQAGDGYVFMGLVRSANYVQATPIFARMMESFRFLK